MRISKISRLRTGATLLAVGGLGLGLIGSGIHAAITDGGTVTATVHTGALSCAVSSTDPLGVPSTDRKSVTVTEPPIASSTAGSLYLADLTVTNTGTMPAVVHWTETTAGTVIWQPNTVAGRGSFGVAIGTGQPGDPTRLDSDIILAAGAHQTYGQNGNGIGFQWTELGNADFGATASVTYAATCGEVSPPVVTGFVPTSGSIAGGTSVVITGTGFTGATAVKFDVTAATSFTVNSATQITAVSPAHAAGPVSVSVTTPNSTAVSSGTFTFVNVNAPAFTSSSTTFFVGAISTATVSATPTTGTYRAAVSMNPAGQTLPAGITWVAGTGSSSYKGTLAGTPTVAGTYPLTFQATNSAGTVTETYTVTVTTLPPPPLTFTMTSPSTGILGGPGGNGFQITGFIHNGATLGGNWKSMTLSIPYTISNGYTLIPEVAGLSSVWSTGSTASVSGGNLIIFLTTASGWNSTMFGPGGTVTDGNGNGRYIIFIDGSPGYGATVTLGTPVVTATS